MYDTSRHRRCSVKRLLLEMSQNSQENTCARVCILIKLQRAARNTKDLGWLLPKFETKSLKMLWERVQFSKVWNLQPATLLLAYSFIRHELLYRCCSIFYLLFRNKNLKNMTWWLLPLFVGCCSTIFFVLFRNTHSAIHYLVAAPIIC